VKTDGELHHRPGATLSAGSQTVRPTIRFSPATTVEFTAAGNTHSRFPVEGTPHDEREEGHIDCLSADRRPKQWDAARRQVSGLAIRLAAVGYRQLCGVSCTALDDNLSLIRIRR